jgi:ribulose-5-phosphate 4-epimerase/fuculose-1-phosphate aldolase
MQLLLWATGWSPSVATEVTTIGTSEMDKAASYEKHIHLGLYRARLDVGAVAYAHPDLTVALTASGRQLLPLYGADDPYGLALAEAG